MQMEAHKRVVAAESDSKLSSARMLVDALSDLLVDLSPA